jgi:hypothetical protein
MRPVVLEPFAYDMARIAAGKACNKMADMPLYIGY